MANISALNGNSCADIGAIDGIAFANIAQFDGNPFCPSPTPTPTPTQSPSNVTPTPTPTITPTPTPSAVCDPTCCYVELCFADRDCSAACQCNDVVGVYLHLPCQLDPCELGYADGIFDDSGCTSAAKEGYYSDGVSCYLWQSGILTLQGTC